MKLLITGGSLEATIQGNPLEKIQEQLSRAVQSQEDDIDTVSSKLRESSDRMKRIDEVLGKYKADSVESRKASDRAQKDIDDLQAELNDAIAKLLANDESNPSMIALKEKTRNLVAIINRERAKSKELRSAIDEISQRKPVTRITNVKKITNVTNVNKITKVTKVVVKQAKDEGVARLHETIRNMKRVPVSKYPKSELQVRTSIARAGVAPHSSDSNMHDKLGAVARMPI